MTPGKGYRFLTLLPLLGAFAVAIWQMRYDWTYDETYHYGWTVLPLALYLFSLRWRDRPLPGRMLSLEVLGTSWGVLAALYPLAWLVRGANPEWRLLGVVFAGMAVLTALLYLATHGGRNWLRHFAGPVLFFLTAIPWPSVLEKSAAALLMPANAVISLEVLHWLEVPAIRSGHLITLPNGTLGVEEACSGIRSLQGSLMAAIFLGELFRFKIGRRLSLVAFSLVFAFVTNVFRVGFLSWSAARDGLGAVDRWHDPAGFTTLAICVGAILVLAFFMDRNSGPLRVLAHVPAATPFPRWLAPTLIVWIAVTLVGTELWYRDAGPTPEGPWTVAVPAESKPIAVAPSARAQLRYDTAQGATWAEPGGARWLIYFFDWSYGPAFSRVAASMHNPGICLPASGRELTEERGKLVFNVDGEPLAFRGYTFNEGGKPLFVYHGVWQFRSERGMSHGPLSESKQAASIQSVLWRERRIGQQAAELAVWGCTTVEEADAAFQKLLPTLIRPRRAALAAAL